MPSPAALLQASRLADCFIGRTPTKQFIAPTKPFSCPRANVLKRCGPRSVSNDAANKSQGFEQWDDKMRTLSLSMILAFTLILSGASVAGSSDNGLPHAGLFQVIKN